MYLVQVMADDGNDGTTTQDLSISIINQPTGGAGNYVYRFDADSALGLITLDEALGGTLGVSKPA